LDGALRERGTDIALAEHRGPPKDGVQGRAQLVRDDREEVVLQAAGRLGFGAGPLGGLVEARAIERLAAVLRHRDEQSPVLLIEIDGHAEIEPQHADSRAIHQQWQGTRRHIRHVGRGRRGAPILLLRFVPGSDEHGLAARKHRRFAQPILDRHALRFRTHG
jgi:hypothetical protein